MGKGKGNHFEWIAPIRIGQILIEFRLRRRKILDILFILRKCKKRVPFKCQIVSKTKKLLKIIWKKNLIKFFKIMIFTNTQLKCIDNSGALIVKCIRILGKSPRCQGFPVIILLFQLKPINHIKKLKKVKFIKLF